MNFERRREQLVQMYRAFMARDAEAATALMHSDVEWPNGWEGGYLHGPAEVLAYWVRQWAAISPTVEPVAFSQNADDRVRVSVRQTIRDLAGAVVSDDMVRHLYTFEDDLIRRMDIERESEASHSLDLPEA